MSDGIKYQISITNRGVLKRAEIGFFGTRKVIEIIITVPQENEVLLKELISDAIELVVKKDK